MRVCTAFFAVAAWFCAGAPVAAQEAGENLPQDAEPLTLNRTVVWEGAKSDGRAFEYGGTRVTVTLNRAKGGEWVDSVSYEIGRPAGPALAIDIPAGLEGYGQVGVYSMGDAAGPVLIVGAYTGGAHCCEQIHLIDLGAPGAVAVDGGAYDGESVAPVDADGDGRFELVVSDPRFHYTFDCYACGAPPAAVFTLRGGEFTDISAQPAFRPLFVDDFNRYAGICVVEGRWQAGACAGLLGAAARLGVYDGLRRMLAPIVTTPGAMASGWETFSFCADEECAGQTEFTDFLEAVDYAFGRWGYLPAADADRP